MAIIFAPVPVHAQEINSSSYRIVPFASSAGGSAGSGSYIVETSVAPVSGTANVTNTVACFGFFCAELQVEAAEAVISFLLNFNISGAASDVALADTKSFGFYRAADLNTYFGCVQDASLTNTPTFGVVSAGTTFAYVNLSNATNTSIRVGQREAGNTFLIAATQTGCAAIGSKLPLILFVPFVGTGEAVDAVELFLAYPGLDIAGTAERTGRFILVLEKNQSNQIVVDII